jgi:hypothetical protein
MAYLTEAEIREALEIMLDVYGYSYVKRMLDDLLSAQRIAGFIQEGMTEDEARREYDAELRR